MVKANIWIKARDFSGTPTKDDFKLVQETLPPLKEGDVLFEATFLTVDPYMRVVPIPSGGPMVGEQVAKVIESKNCDYPVGSEWVCMFGWRSHTVFNPTTQFNNLPQVPGIPKSLDLSKVALPSFVTNQPSIQRIPKLDSLPHSLALGTVGMPGATAYIGLLDYGELKSGETVLVNGAAGAVGSVVGQIAKIKGCKVIGYAGSEDKVKWLKEELGFDFAFNYKKVDLSESIKQAAPEGVDVYFDNVGGTFSDTVISTHVRMFGRIVLVGSISGYNSTSPPKGVQLYGVHNAKVLSSRGVLAPLEPRTKWVQAFDELTKWVKEGKLKYREHITKGFDKMPEAFMELFTGANTGKAVIQV